VIFPILLAVTGGVVYHTAAKSIPKDVAPGLVLTVAYAVALVISVAAYLALPLGGDTAPRRLAHPAVLALGLGAAMIELGYVLTYRAAWPISTASVVVNGLVAALLIPVGLLVFREGMSVRRTAGITMCLAGLWLLRR
jgi:multidrug transporter EmrE-like cation transporter